MLSEMEGVKEPPPLLGGGRVGEIAGVICTLVLWMDRGGEVGEWRRSEEEEEEGEEVGEGGGRRGVNRR